MTASVRTVAAGALLGLTWGVLARIWMRLISTSPEFTWSGTAVILASPTIIGLLAGPALVARRRAWRAAWLARGFGGGSMILLGVGAGIIMLASLLFGTLAAARTDWPRWLRAILAVLALVPVGAVLSDIAGLSPLRLVVAVVGYLALVAAMVLFLRISLAPGAAPAVLPSRRAVPAPAAG
jgi:hypothetical protein